MLHGGLLYSSRSLSDSGRPSDGDGSSSRSARRSEKKNSIMLRLRPLHLSRQGRSGWLPISASLSVRLMSCPRESLGLCLPPTESEDSRARRSEILPSPGYSPSLFHFSLLLDSFISFSGSSCNIFSTHIPLSSHSGARFFIE